jgi:CheY-like chemotaxis protein
MKDLPVVLVVDDDELQLLLMKELFRRAGVPVECVTSGQSALEEIRVNSYRCMITDLNMPSMNGLELARHARQLAPQIRITLCTSDQSPQLTARAAEAGIDAVFFKSINYTRMLATVVEDLGMSSRPTARRASTGSRT